MKSFKLLIPTIFVLGLAFYLSCRRLPDVSYERSVEQKFFSIPGNTDPVIKTLAQKIYRQNQQRGFVNRLASRVGFPAWNKSIMQISQNRNINIRSAGGSGKNYAYIPFVSDSRISSVLIVGMSNTDTTYDLLYSEEYSTYDFNYADTNKTNARDVFLLFARFEGLVFGHKDFLIKDSRLFGINSRPPAKATVDFTEGAGCATCSAYQMPEFWEICFTWSGSNCNCPPQWEECDLCSICAVTQCWSGWTIGGGGGDGDGWGDGGSGGGEGGGGGGGNNGGNWEDEPCEEDAGGGRVMPCDGVQGWISIGGGNNSPALPPYIINTLTKPCLDSALYKLSGGSTNTFFKQIYNTFDTSSILHLLITEADLTANNAYGTATPPINILSGVSFTITLDTVSLLSCSQEWMAYVLIHEIAHVAMFASLIQWDTTNSQHNAMMSQYLTQMATNLTAAYPSLSMYDAYSICYTGFNNAIDGISSDPSLLYIMLKQVKTKLNDQSITAQQLVSRGEEYNENGTRGLRTGCN